MTEERVDFSATKYEDATVNLALSIQQFEWMTRTIAKCGYPSTAEHMRSIAVIERG